MFSLGLRSVLGDEIIESFLQLFGETGLVMMRGTVEMRQGIKMKQKKVKEFLGIRGL